MADADVIPLGTRGRPGRGTGRTNPSASSRTLSAKPAKPAKPANQPAGQPADPVRPDPTGGPETPRRPDSPGSPGDTAEAPARAGGDGDEAPVERRVEEPSAGSGSPPSPRPKAEPPRPDRLPLSEIVAAATHAAHQVFGEDADRRLAELLAFARRRVTGDYAVDEFGLDLELTERFLLEAIRPLATRWFRVEIRGAENIPQEGGALVVANHSGTIPLDGLITMFAVHETTGRNLRPLGADLVFRLPFVGEMARKAGATLACTEDATRMLGKGELVGVWPEGFKGVGKLYSERYKLQRFGRGGFVSAAVKTGVPLVPCSIVGAEEIYPMIGNVPALARLLGLPYVPITPLFPLLGPLGLIPLPSKWIIEFGEPVRTDSYDEGAADDPMLVFNVTDQVRETIQQTLYTLLMRRKSVFH